MAGSERLRVAMVFNWFLYYVAAWANELADSCDLLVVTRSHGLELGIEGSAVEQKRAMLRPEIELEFMEGDAPDLRSVSSALSAARRIRAFGPDIVHVQDGDDWRVYVASAFGGPAHTLHTVHDVVQHEGADHLHEPAKRKVRRRMLKRADGFVVHGETLRELMLDVGDVGDRPVFAIPHGVLAQPARVEPLPEKPRLLFFGRMEPYKGLDDLIPAVRLVREDHPDVRLVLAGRGPEAERLRADTAGDPTFEWVERFIPDEELPDLFADALLVTMPYTGASQSGVVPLAFANGRTVLATRVGALAEAIDDGVTGVLCEPNDPPGLARAIGDLLSDRERLEALSAGALAAVRDGDLSAAHVAAEHVRAYESLIEGAR